MHAKILNDVTTWFLLKRPNKKWTTFESSQSLAQPGTIEGHARYRFATLHIRGLAVRALVLVYTDAKFWLVFGRRRPSPLFRRAPFAIQRVCKEPRARGHTCLHNISLRINICAARTARIIRARAKRIYTVRAHARTGYSMQRMRPAGNRAGTPNGESQNAKLCARVSNYKLSLIYRAFRADICVPLCLAYMNLL